MFVPDNLKRNRGGASYETPQGYKPSKWWSFYAGAAAQDGSEDQLIAALTQSVPEQWLKERGIKDDDSLPGYNYIPGMNEQVPEGQKRLLEGTRWGSSDLPSDYLDRSQDYYLNQYTRGLQNRLRDQFKREKKGMEEQGTANLRDQAQGALTNDFKSIDADANARGLLFSGQREAARGAAASQRAGELGQATTDYAQSLGDMERGINSDVFKSEMDSSLRQADMNDLMSGAFYNRMRRTSRDQAAQAQAAQSFGSGFGSLSGALAGRLRKNQGQVSV